MVGIGGLLVSMEWSREESLVGSRDLKEVEE